MFAFTSCGGREKSEEESLKTENSSLFSIKWHNISTVHFWLYKMELNWLQIYECNSQSNISWNNKI
jgi:hypothetical protein